MTKPGLAANVVSMEREEIAALSEDELRALPQEELNRRVLRAESAAVATSAAHMLLARVSFPQLGAVLGVVPLASKLTDEQRAVAELMARREGLVMYPFALPKARVTRARWLGLEPPSLLEKTVSVEVNGETVSLPLWAARVALKLPWRVASLSAWLTPKETLTLYGELLLHAGYNDAVVFDHQEVWALLDAHAADFVPQAEALLDTAKRYWASSDEAERGGWTSTRANVLLSSLMLYPLALAGRKFGAEEAMFIPFQFVKVGDHEPDRTTLLALPEGLRESTLLAAYEFPPTLTAVTIALDILRAFPLPALAIRVAKDFWDPSLKKQLPKIPYERLVKNVAAFCSDMPELAPYFDKPKRKSAAAKKA